MFSSSKNTLCAKKSDLLRFTFLIYNISDIIGRFASTLPKIDVKAVFSYSSQFCIKKCIVKPGNREIVAVCVLETYSSTQCLLSFKTCELYSNIQMNVDFVYGIIPFLSTTK